MRPITLAAAALLALPAAALAQPYTYTINQPASTLTYDISFSAPFQTAPAGSSYIIGTAAGADAISGNADDIASPPGSRTTPGLFGGNLALNTAVNLTGGSISATGTSGATVIHPAGGFSANYNVGAGTCTISGFTSNLLGGGTAGITANASVGYSTFRTREPSCTVIGLGTPITVPVGTINATSIVATQSVPSNSGTLTPVGGQPGHYTFSVPVDAEIVIAATLSGAEVPIDPQPVTLTLTGTVDLTSPTASVTAQAVVDQTQLTPGPTALDALSFNEPLCNGPLLIKLTLASTSVHVGTTASITATGAAAGCGPADIGIAGGLPGSDATLDNNDFIAFINYFFSSNPLADRGVAGGLPGHDGLFDNNDFIVFINQFFAGC